MLPSLESLWWSSYHIGLPYAADLVEKETRLVCLYQKYRLYMKDAQMKAAGNMELWHLEQTSSF